MEKSGGASFPSIRQEKNQAQGILSVSKSGSQLKSVGEITIILI